MRRFGYIAVRWLILALILLFAAFFAFYRFRPIIIANALSKAKNVMTNATNEAIVNVLKKQNINYNDLAVISRQDGIITGIEINTNEANLFKSLISDEIYKIIAKNDYYTVGVPLGDFLISDYTSGLGPKINFRMELAHSEQLDFNSVFSDAGINNVLHQITVKVKVSGSILIVGASKPVSISTTALLAQTVIAGSTPDSFTNVDEYPGGDIADEIFNYAK